jgi:hypothetical protein
VGPRRHERCPAVVLAERARVHREREFREVFLLFEPFGDE